MKSLLVTIASLCVSMSLAQAADTTTLKGQAASATSAATTAIEKGSAKVQELNQKALVNLNTATPEELAKLPGIGPVKAKAIVEARPYHEISDLKKVKGIKEGVIAKIKGMVTVK